MEEVPKITLSCPACGARYRVLESMLGGRVACRQCGERFVLSRDTAPRPEPTLGAEDETVLSGEDRAMVLGQLAVRLRILTPEALEQGLGLQARQPGRRLGEVLVEAGLMSSQQLEFLLSVQQMKEERIADHRFGHLVISNGFASMAQVEQAMAEQKSRFMKRRETVRIGDLLVERGVLTAEQRDALLVAQQRLKESEATPVETAAEPLEVEVRLAEDHLAAYVLITGSGRPDRHDIEAALRHSGVVFGIDQEAIDRLCKDENNTGGEPVQVARGRVPEPGRDALIEYMFETSPLKAGRETEDGKIDFKDRGEVPEVKAGTLLARKLPSKPGNPGTDVLGKPLAAPAGKDHPLRPGKGTELGPDRQSIVATADGRPSLSGTGVISVFPEYQIDGDVGYKTGHVEFHGRVVVMGAIQNGFKVRCGELVAQEIQEAEVETEGDVFVSGGVIGARIRAGGSIKTHYLQHSTIAAMGDVLIAREVIDSSLECRGALIGDKARVLGSDISAYKGIRAGDIGSESSRPCRLTVGVDERLQHELERLEGLVDEQRRNLAALEAELEQARARNQDLIPIIGEQAQVQDRAMVRQRELERQPGASPEQLAELRQRAEEAERVLNELFDEQDRLNELLDAAPSRRQAIEQALVAVEIDERELQAWAAQDPGSTRVQVTGTLRQNTIIRTPHTESRLANDHRRAQFEERELESENGEREWRLTPVR